MAAINGSQAASSWLGAGATFLPATAHGCSTKTAARWPALADPVLELPHQHRDPEQAQHADLLVRSIGAVDPHPLRSARR